MRIGSLCSGVGGLDLGLERAGVGKVAWQVERDEWCRSVLARRWPGVAQFDDLKTVGAKAGSFYRFVEGVAQYSDRPREGWTRIEHELESFDVLCGGIPCQPASLAGSRK